MPPGVAKNRATLKRAFRVSGKPAFHWPAGVGFSVTSRIVTGSDDNTPVCGFNEFYSMRVLERLGVAHRTLRHRRTGSAGVRRRGYMLFIGLQWHAAGKQKLHA
jgi:hypothetical protein